MVASCASYILLPTKSTTTSKMLDSFEILTTSGVVLWSRKYAPVGVNIINALIKDVFIEESDFNPAADVSAARSAPYKKDKYTLKWATSKDLGLVFVVR